MTRKQTSPERKEVSDILRAWLALPDGKRGERLCLDHETVSKIAAALDDAR